LFLLLTAFAGQPVSAAEPAVPAGGRTPPAAAAPAGVAVTAEQSVLERFRLYAGERTPEGLSALFGSPASTKIRQQPRIAISDGRTAVIVAIRIAALDGTAPNFSLRGASQVSLQRKKPDEWLLTALPAKGSLEVALMVATGKAMLELPLTVAPPLPADTDLSLQAFKGYLKEKGSDSNPLQDLDGDGQRDYRDDYIFTANYLSRQSTTGRSPDARRQRALQRTLSVKPAPPASESSPRIITDPTFQP